MLKGLGCKAPTHKGGIAHEAEGIATDDAPQSSSILLSPECLAPGWRQRQKPRDNRTKCGQHHT